MAVEVLSPNDRAVEVKDKIQQWLDADCRCAWVVNPVRKTITVHQKNAQPSVLHATDDLQAPDLLPGFEVKVREFFPPDID